MGLFSWLFAKQRLRVDLSGPGKYSVDVVGESQYQEELEEICEGYTEDGHSKIVDAILIHENDNPYDNQAIRVDIDGMTVGYLSRENARQFRKKLKEAGYPALIILLRPIHMAHFSGAYPGVIKQVHIQRTSLT